MPDDLSLAEPHLQDIKVEMTDSRRLGPALGGPTRRDRWMCRFGGLDGSLLPQVMHQNLKKP